MSRWEWLHSRRSAPNRVNTAPRRGFRGWGHAYLSRRFRLIVSKAIAPPSGCFSTRNAEQSDGYGRRFLELESEPEEGLQIEVRTSTEGRVDDRTHSKVER